MPMGTGTEQSFGAGDGKGTTHKSGIEKLWFFMLNIEYILLKSKEMLSDFFHLFRKSRLKIIHTVCPRSLDPLYAVTYYKIWVKTNKNVWFLLL